MPEQLAATGHSIELRLEDVSQLFHTLDPFPFRERDLGPLLPTTSMMHGRFLMKRVTLALATLLFAFAVIPSADARVVQPSWVVVRWSYGDCKIWRNDTGPWYPGWQAVAYANTYPEAWAKMQALYGRRWSSAGSAITLALGHHEDRTPTRGYEPTR